MICSCCKQDLPKESFYKENTFKRGRGYLCKPCNRERKKGYYSKYRAENLEKVKEGEKLRARKYRKRNMKKVKSREKANNNPREKVLCLECGSIENLEYHHEDYSKPLETVVLCRSCHDALHLTQTEGDKK